MKPMAIALVLIAWMTAAAGATTLHPDDFAFGLTVHTEGKAPLWRVTLPEDVYRHVVRPDLGDLRVFDAAGRSVPYTLGRPQTTPTAAPPPVDLPVFALRAPVDSEAAGQAVRIITDDHGHVVKAVSEAIRPGQKTRVAAYLLDASALRHEPNRLELHWELGAKTGFVVPVNVEASDDLTHWHTLATKQTLADLHSGGHTLIHREIRLPLQQDRYLRLSWPMELDGVRLTRVVAEFPAGVRPPQRHWLQVRGTVLDTSPSAYRFDTGGYWPADRVGLSFSGGNVTAVGTLSSRPSASAPWQSQYRGLFYKLVADGASLTSEPVAVSASGDRYWRLEVASGETDLSGTAPTLELGWVPRTLTFVAEGDPPYTIAYGSALIGPPQQPLDALLRMLKERQEPGMVKPAEVGEPHALGGVARLTPPAPPLPWRRWVLLTVLVLGALLLGWMVWRLYQQMNPPGE